MGRCDWVSRTFAGTRMPELPSGTVTFLFTDIEGSTALWERDATAMRAAVERHLTLLDAAITAVQQETRHYAKRQFTWLRGQTPEWERVEPGP